MDFTKNIETIVNLTSNYIKPLLKTAAMIPIILFSLKCGGSSEQPRVLEKISGKTTATEEKGEASISSGNAHYKIPNLVETDASFGNTAQLGEIEKGTSKAGTVLATSGGYIGRIHDQTFSGHTDIETVLRKLDFDYANFFDQIVYGDEIDGRLAHGTYTIKFSSIDRQGGSKYLDNQRISRIKQTFDKLSERSGGKVKFNYQERVPVALDGSDLNDMEAVVRYDGENSGVSNGTISTGFDIKKFAIYINPKKSSITQCESESLDATIRGEQNFSNLDDAYDIINFCLDRGSSDKFFAGVYEQRGTNNNVSSTSFIGETRRNPHYNENTGSNFLGPNPAQNNEPFRGIPPAEKTRKEIRK